MKHRFLTLSLIALTGLASCQREATDYISVQGKIFIFNIRLAQAYYTLNLNRLPATPDDAVVRAEFEDPAGGPALVSEQKVFPKMARIDLQSPRHPARAFCCPGFRGRAGRHKAALRFGLGASAPPRRRNNGLKIGQTSGECKHLNTASRANSATANDALRQNRGR